MSITVFTLGFNLMIPADNYVSEPNLTVLDWSSARYLVTSLLRIHQIRHSVFDDRIEVPSEDFEKHSWYQYRACTEGGEIEFDDEWENGVWREYSEREHQTERDFEYGAAGGYRADARFEREEAREWDALEDWL